VSLTEWLSVVTALAQGHGRATLQGFYGVVRALVVKKESLYDRYDRAFGSYFEGVEDHFNLDDELMRWLENPVLPRDLSPEEMAEIEAWDLDKLREEFLKRLREQTERHDGGNKWIGTGGTSPYGYGGYNPAGVRIGGPGGGRSAVQVAEMRRYQNLRRDRILDTRIIGAALRRLRKLARDQGPLELDVDETIDKSARDGGEIDLVFSPERRNKVKLLLLMDVGGSMDPYVDVCEQLFSAAFSAHHFKALRYYFFHNCVYEHLFTDISQHKGIATEDALKEIDASWTVIFVGDAWMSPYELSHPGGSIYLFHHNREPGIEWLRRIRGRCPNSVWLNPEPPRIWNADSIAMIRHVFPMFHLTLDGLAEAVDVLRGARPNVPEFDTRYV